VTDDNMTGIANSHKSCTPACFLNKQRIQSWGYGGN